MFQHNQSTIKNEVLTWNRDLTIFEQSIFLVCSADIPTCLPDGTAARCGGEARDGGRCFRRRRAV